jgi:septation ring formation regulator EzrA
MNIHRMRELAGLPVLKEERRLMTLDLQESIQEFRDVLASEVQMVSESWFDKFKNKGSRYDDIEPTEVVEPEDNSIEYEKEEAPSERRKRMNQSERMIAVSKRLEAVDLSEKFNKIKHIRNTDLETYIEQLATLHVFIDQLVKAGELVEQSIDQSYETHKGEFASSDKVEHLKGLLSTVIADFRKSNYHFSDEISKLAGTYKSSWS